MLSYDSIASLVEAAEKEGKKISEVVLADQAADMGLSEEEVFAKMDHDVDVMIEAVQGRPFRQYCEPRHDAGPFRIRLQRFHGAHRGYADGRQLRHHAWLSPYPHGR